MILRHFLYVFNICWKGVYLLTQTDSSIPNCIHDPYCFVCLCSRISYGFSLLFSFLFFGYCKMLRFCSIPFPISWSASIKSSCGRQLLFTNGSYCRPYPNPHRPVCKELCIVYLFIHAFTVFSRQRQSYLLPAGHHRQGQLPVHRLWSVCNHRKTRHRLHS